jgi:uncharacterized protein (TIGR00369 family)
MIWEEPPRGGTPPKALWARSGREQVQALVDGAVPAPAIHYLTGMHPTAVGAGTAEFQMPATGWLASPSGMILGGVLAMLADGPLGCAIHSRLPPGTAYTTSELSMSYLRPGITDGRTLTARGRAIHVGRTLALSDALVTDEDGRDLAHATSRCFVFAPQEVPDPPPPLPPLEDPGHDTLPPYVRPAEGVVMPEAVWQTQPGLEILRGWIDGSLPAPPISHLTGLRPAAAEEGRCGFVMPATGWLASPTGAVEGGALVMLADAALTGAVQTTVPAATRFAPIDITVKFIRPVMPGAGELSAGAQVVHRGKTLAVAEGQVRNAQGKLVCVAIGSAMILA